MQDGTLCHANAVASEKELVRQQPIHYSLLRAHKTQHDMVAFSSGLTLSKDQTATRDDGFNRLLNGAVRSS